MNNFGQFAVSSFLAPAQPLQVTTGVGWEYIRIINNSAYSLNVNLAGMGSIVMPEYFLEDIYLPQGYRGSLVITPSINVSVIGHSTSNMITVNAYQHGEISQPQAQPLSQPAVTTTASGKPIYSASVGFGSTATIQQVLNVFNPPNSGVTFTFHSCRCFTNDSTIPTVNLSTNTGGDNNCPGAVAAVSHSGQKSPPVSFAHCTSQDAAEFFTGPSIIETMDMQQNVTQDVLAFPDIVTLAPGNNLWIETSSGTTGKIVRLTLKWTEDIAFPAQGGVLSGMAITTLVNQGFPKPTPIVTASPIGDGATATLINNDGTMTLGDILNPGLLTLLGPLDSNIASSATHAGSVSGTITLWQPLQGSAFKFALLYLNNYQDAANQSLAFPAPFTNMTAVFAPHDTGVAGNGGVALLNGITAQNATILSSVAAAGGSGTTQTSIFKFSFAEVVAPGVTIDHIQVLAMTTAHTGMVFILGN